MGEPAGLTLASHTIGHGEVQSFIMAALWQFIPYLLTASICSVIIEIILSVSWVPGYFSSGIAIYVRKIKIAPGEGRLPTAKELESALSTLKGAPLLVREIGKDRFAFREKLFYCGAGGYSPVMRGYLVVRPEKNELEVRGYLNWYLFFFSICLLFFLVTTPTKPAALIITCCFLVLVSYIYLIQKKRFMEVDDMVRQLWK